MSADLLKWLHVLAAVLLVGGGFGSAFHLLIASARRRPDEAAAAVHSILRFDALVGAPMFVLLAVGGFALLGHTQASWTSDWVALALLLYAAVLMIWMPVIACELRMRRLARDACTAGQILPMQYWRMLIVWSALGAFGFALFAGIFWLMLTKRVPFS